MLRRSKNRSKIFTKDKILLFIIIIFTPALFLGILKSDIFTIKKIEVKNDKANCITEDSLINKSTVSGKNFFWIDEKKITDILKASFICIKNIYFSKNLPDKIKLNIIGRSPVAVINSVKDFEATASSLIEDTATPSAMLLSAAYLVDDEGIVFSKGNLANLPHISMIGQDLTVGVNFANDYLKKTLKILSELKRLSFDRSQTYIFNNFFITIGSPKVVFDLNEDIDIQIASLQLIVQKAKIDSAVLEFIDLRFDKPIVKFAPKKNG